LTISGGSAGLDRGFLAFEFQEPIRPSDNRVKDFPFIFQHFYTNVHRRLVSPLDHQGYQQSDDNDQQPESRQSESEAMHLALS
jgi:hypothetical protein